MELIYKLDDRVPTGKTLFYSLQHVVLYLSAGIAVMLVVGIALELPIQELSALMRRSFFISGLFSILQGVAGHRYPIVEGPAGIWASMILLLASVMDDIETFRTDLQAGVMLGGSLVVLVTIIGLTPYIFKLFTPAVNGVLIMLMVLQISPGIARGMVGLTAENEYIDGANVFVFFFTIAVILVLNVLTKGFVKSIAILIGTAAGWIIAIPTGFAIKPEGVGGGVFTLPKVFAFGTPTWNPGILIVCVFTSFVVLSMVFASMTGMSEVVDKKLDMKGLKKGILIHGVSAISAGVFPIVPNIPFIIPIGMVVMTGVAARRPFLIGGMFLLIMGLISPVGSLFSAIPVPVGYAVMAVSFSLIFRQGLHEVKKASANLTEKVGYTVGIPMIIGVGVMLLPFSVFSQLPGVLPYLLSNGLIDGTVTAIILDRLLLRKPDGD